MFDLFSNLPQPDIYLWGYQINEPVTALTGLFITFFCIYAYRQLNGTGVLTKEARWMLFFFLFLGSSNLFGSLAGHAFKEQLGLAWKAPGWTLGMVAVFIVGQVSVWRYTALNPGKTGQVISFFNMAAMLSLAWMSVTQLNFKLVEMYSAVGLLLVMLPLEIWLFRKGEKEVSYWMMMALIPAVVAVLLHILKFSVSKWLNYFDIGHLLLCITVIFFLKGARKMGESADLQTFKV